MTIAPNEKKVARRPRRRTPEAPVEDVEQPTPKKKAPAAKKAPAKKTSVFSPTRALHQFWDLKKTMKEAKEQADGLQAELIVALEAEGSGGLTVKVGDTTLTGTIVRGSSMEIDYDRLAGDLTRQQLEAITTEVIDNKKLEDAIATGAIDADLVVQCATEKPRKPYIRVTEGAKNVPEPDEKEPSLVTRARKRSAAGERMQQEAQ